MKARRGFASSLLIGMTLSLVAADLSRSQAAACPDADMDGYVDRFTQPSCSIPAGKQAGDCDDADPAVHPGAQEVCNQRDDDCDGAFDEGHTAGYKTYLGEVGESFGQAVAAIGDVNDDTITDFVVGADEYPRGAANYGRIAVFSGIDGSLLCEAFGSGNDKLGTSVSALGDVTGDHRPEFLAGAPGHDRGTVPDRDPDSGAVRVFGFEPGSGTCVLVHEFDGGTDAFDRLGTSVAGVGDIDGDTLPDVAAGAPHAGPGARGKIIVFSLGTEGAIREYVDPLGLTNDQLGTAVAGLDDVNDDGYLDLIAGAENAYGENEGVALVFSGEESNSVLHRLRQPNPGIGEAFGAAVGRMDDLDGDNVGEILISAPGAGSQAEGLVFVHSGAGGGLLCAGRDFYAVGGHALGRSVVGLADVTGDGFPDFAAGAPKTPLAEGGVQAGAVLVFSGEQCLADPDDEIYAFQKLLDPEAATSDHLGRSLASLGDVNGDGVADLLTGSPDDDVPVDGSNQANAGSVSVLSVEACSDGDDQVWGLPGGVADLHFAEDGALEWNEPGSPGGASASAVILVYDVIRSGAPAGFDLAGTCVETGDVDLWAVDSESPAVGEVFHYLVRAGNVCGLGPVGEDSAGVARRARTCP